MASPNRWTWVWVNSRSCWWTGWPGVLWFMGSQRIRHDWGTELNWTDWTLLYCRRQWHPTPVLLPGKSHGQRSLVGYSPWIAKSRTGLSDFTFTFHFHALEKEMATHSSVLAWKLPGTGEPGGLPSMGSHRVGHDWSDAAAAAALLYKLFLYKLLLKTSSHSYPKKGIKKKKKLDIYPLSHRIIEILTGR